MTDLNVAIRKTMKLEPGNIWSGNRRLAVLTNPTELAFKKGNLKYHWPVYVSEQGYSDVEAAYHALKVPDMDFQALQDLLISLIACKLRQYPVLVSCIQLSGASEWLKKCSHFTGARTQSFKQWEGQGIESAFIRCLLKAFEQVREEN